MPRPAPSLADILDARHVDRGAASARRSAPSWGLDALAGRLVELAAGDEPAQLTAAFTAVRGAQRRGEIAAWVTSEKSSFFPPDVAAAGVDLGALIVVRLSSAAQIPRAADRLIRSGALGLAVLDLASDDGAAAPFPAAYESRLAGLARRHGTAVILLADADRGMRLGPLVSLRGEARRRGEHRLEIRIVRDKRGASGTIHAEPCRGPAGLR
ncbi:MAG: recombinase A [Proteobacteria bacterium]|jgi:recombination protein RecA|nr:recombinase A [Pseudomonadota bacterium]